jgi:predicted CoA-binding protein
MNAESELTVVVLGASPNPERYSHKAVLQLKQHGFRVIPVHPQAETIADCGVVPRLEEVTGPVDTVTMYVNAARSADLVDSLQFLAPRRVIFNPGAENSVLQRQLEGVGVECVEACTLVMLATGQF